MQKPIHRDVSYHESPFKRWVKDNVDALMESQYKDEIHSHGLPIATSVYSTKNSSLTSLTDSSRKIRVGFKVTAEDLIDVETDGGWYLGATPGRWNHYEGERRLL